MRGLRHLKPKYRNFKEEVLQNSFYPLSKDTWGQAVSKANKYKNSAAGRKIRTRQDGEYHDQILGHHYKWKKGADVTADDITTIKLYTDYDKLQGELKKCFRIESVDDVRALLSKIVEMED